MAHVLLADPDKVAQTAMKGILAQRGHRFAAVDTGTDAWDFILRNVKVDLLLVELKLMDESGLDLIERLKNDHYFKSLPIVVYTSSCDRASVKNVLSLNVQNFLLKPYRDSVIFSEVAKAMARPWRQQHFMQEDAVCQRFETTPEELLANLDELLASLDEARVSLRELAQKQVAQPMIDVLRSLAAKSKRGGAIGVLVSLRELNERALASDWPGLTTAMQRLDFVASLLAHHLDPSRTPEDFLSAEEEESDKEDHVRAFWADAPSENRCPLASWPQLQRKISSLQGCPVVDSIVAAFQMAANGHPTSLSPLLDLVQKDPSLTAQILIASNRLKKGKGDGESAPIEEPRMAVGLLGELRLASLGGNLVTLEERLMLAPPNFSWQSYRAFQMGTARLARFVCSYLEMPSLEASAYTAGLLHDIGKLLLMHMYPWAFQAIHEHAQSHGMKLADAERFFLGATTLQMGAHFAEKQGLPKRFSNVMRWMGTPEEAIEDAELVAIVSLARDLCRHNRVGCNGDTLQDDAIPLEDTAEWRVLSTRVFLNFDLKRFERQAHLECQHLKRELQGRLVK